MSDHEIVVMNTFLGQYRSARVRLFRRNILNKVMQDLYTNKVHKVQSGTKGQADCYGYVHRGRYMTKWCIPFEVEFKGPKTRVSDEQTAWRDWCLEWGVPHLVLRGVETESTTETVVRYTKELNEFVERIST